VDIWTIFSCLVALLAVGLAMGADTRNKELKRDFDVFAAECALNANRRYLEMAQAYEHILAEYDKGLLAKYSILEHKVDQQKMHISNQAEILDQIKLAVSTEDGFEQDTVNRIKMLETDLDQFKDYTRETVAQIISGKLAIGKRDNISAFESNIIGQVISQVANREGNNNGA
jgi:hypothetical protein